MWFKVLRRILFSLATVFLVIAAFVAGAVVAKLNPRDSRPLELPTTPAQETRRARELVEEALAARFAGDHGKALQLLDEAVLADPAIRGAEYQRGLTFLSEGNYAAAETSARASLSKNESVADAYALLVMCAAGRAAAGEATDPEEVAEWATKARQTDPLAGFYHYAQGEYARATGRPVEAVEHYRRALERVSAADSFLVATVKAGLSGLRLRQSSGVKTVMPSIEDQSLPPEWLFFAAAQALLDGDQATAKAFLERARQVVRPEIFSALLKDSFFEDFLPDGMIITETSK